MPSGRFRYMDPFCGVTEMEVYNINNLSANQNNHFENINPDISINHNSEYFSIQSKRENKDKKILLLDS